MFLFRGLLFVVITILATLLSFLPSILLSGWYFRLYRLWSKMFFSVFGIKEHIHHENQHPLPAQYIMISNHPSGIDVIWLPGMFDVVPLSKDDIKYSWIVGNITRAAGIIFVNRSDSASRSGSLMTCLREIKKGNNLLIFPEGGCFGKGLHPFISGAFDIAFLTKIPILPVYLFYEERKTYVWGNMAPGPYIKRLLFNAKNRNGHLYIFDAIKPDAFANADALKKYTFNFYSQQQQEFYDRNLHPPNF